MMTPSKQKGRIPPDQEVGDPPATRVPAQRPTRVRGGGWRPALGDRLDAERHRQGNHHQGAGEGAGDRRGSDSRRYAWGGKLDSHEH